MVVCFCLVVSGKVLLLLLMIMIHLRGLDDLQVENRIFVYFVATFQRQQLAGWSSQQVLLVCLPVLIQISSIKWPQIIVALCMSNNNRTINMRGDDDRNSCCWEARDPLASFDLLELSYLCRTNIRAAKRLMPGKGKALSGCSVCSRGSWSLKFVNLKFIFLKLNIKF